MPDGACYTLAEPVPYQRTAPVLKVRECVDRIQAPLTSPPFLYADRTAIGHWSQLRP